MNVRRQLEERLAGALASVTGRADNPAMVTPSGRHFDRGAGEPRSERAADAEAAPRTRAYLYTVRSGDTLSAISQRFYGDASRWDVILKANSRRLARPSDLRVGMKLIVPIRDRRAQAGNRGGDALARAGPRRRE